MRRALAFGAAVLLFAAGGVLVGQGDDAAGIALDAAAATVAWVVLRGRPRA